MWNDLKNCKKLSEILVNLRIFICWILGTWVCTQILGNCIISTTPRIDIDGSGKITFPKFFVEIAFFQNISIGERLTKEAISDLKKNFKAVDIDNDGYITSLELYSAMRESGENPTMEDVEKLMGIGDTGITDGKIDFSEFIQVMTNTKISK